MPRVVVFCLIAPFAFLELILYRRYDVVLLGTLYLGLSIQADFAAGQFLRQSLREKRKSWNAEEDVELKVHPLGERSRAEPARYPPRLEAVPKLERRARDRAEVHSCYREAREPNFQGRAHEVLGVREDAATRTIVRAFRHWIKHFHPDQAQNLPAAVANTRVRQLTDAKELLLDRRRNRRAA